MTLFSGIADLPGRFPGTGIALAVTAALALTACENRGTGDGRNTAGSGTLPGAVLSSRVETPLPGEAGSMPPATTVPSAASPAPAPGAEQQTQGVRLIPPPGMANRSRVALLVPLSGPRADIGRAVSDAGKLALFDVADGDFELRPYDTAATGAGAAAAAQRAVSDGVKLVIGPIFSAAVQGAAFPFAHR
ncbi:MAG: ABC transporter substrate-binding protein [Candidatus Nanopelagicales bacterium]